MITAIIMKVLFTPLSYFKDIKQDGRAFALIEISIALWGVCFIIGWYITKKRVEKLYNNMYEKKALCANEEATASVSNDYMLQMNNKITFFFKALYWFSIAYIHSLFTFAVILIVLYTIYLLVKEYITSVDLSFSLSKNYDANYYKLTKQNGEYNVQTIENGSETYTLPGLMTMKGLFVFFGKEFLFFHFIVFVVCFIFFYISCILFLKTEDPSVPEDILKRNIMTNRKRFQFLLYISYIFIDSCYFIFEIVMLFYLDSPEKINSAIELKKSNTLKESLNQYFEKEDVYKNILVEIPGINNVVTYKTFKSLINKIAIKYLRGDKKRDEICRDIIEKLRSKIVVKDK